MVMKPIVTEPVQALKHPAHRVQLCTAERTTSSAQPRRRVSGNAGEIARRPSDLPQKSFINAHEHPQARLITPVGPISDRQGTRSPFEGGASKLKPARRAATDHSYRSLNSLMPRETHRPPQANAFIEFLVRSSRTAEQGAHRFTAETELQYRLDVTQRFEDRKRIPFLFLHEITVFVGRDDLRHAFTPLPPE